MPARNINRGQFCNIAEMFRFNESHNSLYCQRLAFASRKSTTLLKDILTPFGHYHVATSGNDNIDAAIAKRTEAKLSIDFICEAKLAYMPIRLRAICQYINSGGTFIYEDRPMSWTSPIW